MQELHGTGTALGDPIEVGALRATMMTHNGVTREKGLIKGSSKSNHGHSEACAGMLGIIKCLLLGMNASCAPNVHFRALNPHIDYNGYPVYFTSEQCDQGDKCGYNGVSSFGFGGSNARGDVWSRAVNGPRNTDPEGWKMDLTEKRMLRFNEVFYTDLPKDSEKFIADTDMADYQGDYLTGDPLDCPWLDETPDLFLEGSFNGWQKGQKMEPLEEESDELVFAVFLGDTRVEQFRFTVNDYSDAVIFPADKSTGSQESPVLGPGTAPPGHFWVIDGISDGMPQGTVYKISFRWDKSTRQKRVSWQPTTDEAMLTRAAESRFYGFKHTYSIAGSWNRFVPSTMKVLNGALVSFVATVTIGLTGREEFQFLRDGQQTALIYPACKGSNDVPIRGPDIYGEKKYFEVHGETGDKIDIRIRVWDGDISIAVATMSMGALKFQSMPGAVGRRFFLKTASESEPLPMNTEDGHSEDIYKVMIVVKPSNAETGCQLFQILVDQNPRLAIHPEMPNAGVGVSSALGPDSQGDGLYWSISEYPGTLVEITLDLSQKDRFQTVTWQTVTEPKALESAVG